MVQAQTPSMPWPCARSRAPRYNAPYPSKLNVERSPIISPCGIVAGWLLFLRFFSFYSQNSLSVLVSIAPSPTYKYTLHGLAEEQATVAQFPLLILCAISPSALSDLFSETTMLAVNQRPHAQPCTLHLLTVKADIPRSFRDPAYPFGGRATNTCLSATPSAPSRVPVPGATLVLFLSPYPLRTHGADSLSALQGARTLSVPWRGES